MSLPNNVDVRNFSWSQAAVPFVVIGFPILSLIVVRAKLNQAGSVDPYLYLAYANDYADTLSRFGTTYYSTRVAYIFPEHFFGHLFGARFGYILLRFVALTSATSAIFVIARRYYGLVPAILAAAWLCFTPWLLRSLIWTYVDGFATVYLLAGLALLLSPKRHPIVADALAGSCFALAVNCNLNMFCIVGALAPAWFVLTWSRGFRWQMTRGLIIGAGFVLTELFMGIALHLAYPQQSVFVEEVAIRTALYLAGGGAATWFLPIGTLLFTGHHFVILVPPTVLVVTSFVAVGWRATIRREKDETVDTKRCAFVWTTIFFLGLDCGVVLLQHLFSSGLLGLFYYNVYFIPACALGIIVISGEAQRRLGQVAGAVIVLAAAATLLVFWLVGFDLCSSPLINSLAFWLGLILITVVAAVTSRWIPLASALAFGGIIALSFSLYGSGQGVYCFRQRISAVQAQVEWDVYDGALFLQRFVNANVPVHEGIRFWYSYRSDHVYLNSVQSIFLWGYSRVGIAGMPLVDNQFRQVFSSKHKIALLGLSDAEIDQAVQALKDSSYSYQPIARADYHGKEWGYAIAIGEVEPFPALENDLHNSP